MTLERPQRGPERYTTTVRSLSGTMRAASAAVSSPKTLIAFGMCSRSSCVAGKASMRLTEWLSRTRINSARVMAFNMGVLLLTVGSARGERLQPQRALHPSERVRLWAVVGGARVPVRSGRALGGGFQQPPHAPAVAARRRRSHSVPLTRTPTRTTTPRATALPAARNAPIPAARPHTRIRGSEHAVAQARNTPIPARMLLLFAGDVVVPWWCRGGAGGCRAGVVSAGFCSQ